MQPAAGSSREWIRASDIVSEYARSPLDVFKLWPSGKSYFFSPLGRCVIAYRVASSVAIALGDPVGVNTEIEMTVRAFLQACRTKGWEPAFYQTLPDLLPLYRQQGLRKLKIGDDAIVNLPQFSLEGKSKREVRSKVYQFENMGHKDRRVPATSTGRRHRTIESGVGPVVGNPRTSGAQFHGWSF